MMCEPQNFFHVVSRLICSLSHLNKRCFMLLGCLLLGGISQAVAAGCNRHEICPAICVEDESEACTRITNDSQRCALRKYTCEGCIAVTARTLALPVACVDCVMDAQTAKLKKGVKRISPATVCQAICGGADKVDAVVKTNGC